MRHTSGNRGFTLIELLVVVAIIGMLSSIVLASLNGARAKARDARRLSDLRQLQTALELYYGDNTNYPAQSGDKTVSASLTALVTSNFIAALPTDPLSTHTGTNGYSYCSDGQGYTLAAQKDSGTWCEMRNYTTRPSGCWAAYSNC